MVLKRATMMKAIARTEARITRYSVYVWPKFLLSMA
jgi:hypothetical protein